MITVSIYKNEKHEYVGFKTLGHAGYSEPGQDIVCAAVSVLTINTINSIDKFTEEKTSLVSDEESGFIDYKIDGRPGKEAALLLKAMILGLREMTSDESYEEYIDLTFEEV